MTGKSQDSCPTPLAFHLSALAEKYETKEFLVGDPSWFMHQVEGEVNKELIAFIASSLSYGSRKQFLPKIQYILDRSGGEVEKWLLNERYMNDIPDDSHCYYRLYSNHAMRTFLDALTLMLRQYAGMKSFVGSSTCLEAIEKITQWFALHGSGGVIPKDASSCCKRICMFLRWMVRSDSPVDLGLWSDIIDRRTLIIPMDTHVLQEACRLGLLTSKTTSMTAAIRLTDSLREIFPDDPLKGDFALFGLGVDEERWRGL